MEFRTTATAKDIALTHKHLAESVQALHKIGMETEGYTTAPLNKRDGIRLGKIAHQIETLMLRLEVSFIRLAGMRSPFFNAKDPDAWLRYLEAQKQKAPSVKG